METTKSQCSPIQSSEVWSAIQSYPAYEISDQGKLRSQFTHYGPKRLLTGKWRVIATNSGKNRYPKVRLSDGQQLKCFTIHELVMMAFSGPRPAGCHINHIDGNKHNNAVQNLEYCTPGDNNRHAFRIGLNKYQVPPKNRKLTDEQVLEIYKSDGISSLKLAEKYGVHHSAIWAIRHKKSNRSVIDGTE